MAQDGIHPFTKLIVPSLFILKVIIILVMVHTLHPPHPHPTHPNINFEQLRDICLPDICPKHN
jgi:hypothetical protein